MMEGLELLEETLLRLIGTHACVAVPGLGSFILRHAPASANVFNGEIKPAGETLFFNAALQADDGTVANDLRENLGISYQAALDMISAEVQSLRNGLQQHRNVPLGKLGNFFLNSENQLFFLPSPKLNLSPGSFGLEILNFAAAAKSQTQTEPVAKPVATGPEKKEYQQSEPETEEAEILEISMNPDTDRQRRSLPWKIAATVALVAMAGTSVFLARRFMPAATKVQQATTALPAAEKQATPEPKAAEIPEKKVEKAVYPAEDKGIVEKETAMKTGKGNYFVYTGSYMGETVAKQEKSKLNKVGKAAILVRGKGSSLIRLVIGRFATYAQAENFAGSFSQEEQNKLQIKQLNPEILP
ncbi:MAG: SPOR domain-containing protein [Bacteroidetes bacterium]|nr:SPOR domain-containing protein [Bacteroidota bacterium]